MPGCLPSNLLYEVLGCLFLITSMAGFIAMGVDKARAVGGKRRIPEATLLIISLAGGWAGVAAGAVVFHHKTSKLGFLVTFFPIVVVWIFALQEVGFLGCLGTYIPH